MEDCRRSTVKKYKPVGSRRYVGDYIDDVTEGSIIALDNQGRLDCTVWGDILTGIPKRRGIAGIVIDGCYRDPKKNL